MAQETEEPEEEKGVMTFWEHITELRGRLQISLIVFVVTFFGFYLLSDRLIRFILNHFIGQYNLTLLAPDVMSGFVTQLNITFLLASTYTLPVFMYELFMFIDPALNQKHRMIALKIILSAAILFICGVAFIYFIMLPMLLDFFVQNNASLGLSNFFTVEEFFDFITFNLFIGGLTFQTPLVIIMANRIGILPKEWLSKSRSIIYVVILVIAGVATPDHSIISQLVLGGMMMVLFEISLLFSH
jgi:sec-independent protein translocase protein TatC